MKRTWFENILIGFAFLIIIFFIVQAIFQTGFGWFVDFSFASNFGTAISGILAFISILLLFTNLKFQAKSFYISQFENKFFEFIKFHRENVNSMTYESPESDNINEPKTINGNKVFVEIYNEILLAIDYVNNILLDKKLTDLYINQQLIQKEKESLDLKGRNINLLILEKFNIAYLIVFFGVSKQGKAILNNLFKKKYKKEIILEILNKFESIPVKWSKYRKLFDAGKDISSELKYVKYFGGHQHRLGHYFRHLYQSVKFVDKEKDISYSSKYEYIKSLRAQFSTYEQSIIFFNSISLLGRVWELEQNDFNKQFITKYNLIKNIPAEFITEINIKNFYPLVYYEGSDYPERRKELEKLYK